MKLVESIRSRAYRCLTQTMNFRGGEQAVTLLPSEVSACALPSEQLLGVYENPAPNANIIFTTRGIYIFAGAWIHLEYAEMADVWVFRGENFDIQSADTLIISDRAGHESRLIISGVRVRILSGYERRFPDLWEVLSYFTRVLAKFKS